jgi:hypothetical protein
VLTYLSPEMRHSVHRSAGIKVTENSGYLFSRRERETPCFSDTLLSDGLSGLTSQNAVVFKIRTSDSNLKKLSFLLLLCSGTCIFLCVLNSDIISKYFLLSRIQKIIFVLRRLKGREKCLYTVWLLKKIRLWKKYFNKNVIISTYFYFQSKFHPKLLTHLLDIPTCRNILGSHFVGVFSVNLPPFLTPQIWKLRWQFSSDLQEIWYLFDSVI